MAIKSLIKTKNPFANPAYQVRFLEQRKDKQMALPTFQEVCKKHGQQNLTSVSVDVLQINVGKLCNQICKHCHVDAGPDRKKENMSYQTFVHCLDFIKKSKVHTVDLTGGAPEMNPHFKWFVESCSALDVKIIVRCNLTILVHNKAYAYLPEFYAKHRVEVVSSLPFYEAGRTDRQRGNGVFQKSIRALQQLNDVGYGKKDTGLILNLVYNPSGAFLPNNQEQLEKDFKERLKTDFNISFNQLFAITNLPVSRFLEYLVKTDNYVSYMQKLIDAYNPTAYNQVMCKNIISVSWDGFLFDCDFNQMLDLKISNLHPSIKEVNINELENRSIRVGRHCFGCTAGLGSSCGGQVV